MLKSALTKIWDFLKKIFSGFKIKDFIYIAIISTAIFFGWRAYQSLKGDFQSAQIAYKQLSDQLARASNELVTKAELKEFAKSIGAQLGEVQKDLKSIGASIKAVGQTVAEIKGKIDANQPSDDTTPHDPGEQPTTCKLCDTYGYTGTIQHKNLMLGEMPYGKASFDASSDKPWTLQYDDVGIKVKTIVGEMKDDGLLVFYHTISMLNNTRPELKDKEYALKVVSSEFKQLKKNTKEFFLWSPAVDIVLDNGIYLGYNSKLEYNGGASVGLSIMGYGKTKRDLDWRFIRLGGGINYNHNPYLSLQPFLYNLSQIIPIFHDLWIGPGITYDNHWGLSLSLGTVI